VGKTEIFSGDRGVAKENASDISFFETSQETVDAVFCKEW